MKQIFTLLTIALLTGSSFKANSQYINESFESSAEVTNLQSMCWTFNNFNYTSSTPLVGTGGSVISTIGNAAEIYTPFLQMPSSLAISFSYNTVTSTGGSKTLKILLDNNGVETILESINLQSNPSGNFSFTYTNANTPGANINGDKKVVFRTTANVSLKFDGLTISAPYTYAGGCEINAIPLPLKLISFQGALSNNRSQLQWTVAENESGKYFEIEKSVDGRNYTTAGVVMVTQKTGSETYSYKDDIQNATYYRLKMVNEDGSISYSKIILIKVQVDESNTIALLQNPVRDNLSFSFTSSTDKASDITIYSMSGAKVLTQKIATQKGRNSISIALNSYITSGTYILEVRNNTERSITKFIK
jgi:hypothetical protein